MSDQLVAYHHGDLRAALLQAAEEELIEKGADRFSLRSVAKRASVSHAAPAHHFGDVKGLLIALAGGGFGRFVETMRVFQEKGGADPTERMMQTGFGYIDFALKNPALFRLMFGSRRPGVTDEDFLENAVAAFNHLPECVTDMTGGDPETEISARTDVASAWAVVHGLAELLIAGSPLYLVEAPDDQRQAMIREIISRSLKAA